MIKYYQYTELQLYGTGAHTTTMFKGLSPLATDAHSVELMIVSLTFEV